MTSSCGLSDEPCNFVKADGVRHLGHTNAQCRVQRGRVQREAVVKSIVARGGRSDSGSLKGWKNATKDLPAQYHGICVPTAKNNIDAAAEKQISKPPTQTSKATNVVKDLVTGKVIAKEVVVYGPDGLKVISCTKNAEATPAPSKIVEKKDKPAAVPPHVRAAMAKATAEAGEDA
ncbi:hypothetical protein Slin14017_G018840 [Septoria linicola]|nr:hypothetical protein Slin14017_G018840 [Septoria linicola]